MSLSLLIFTAARENDEVREGRTRAQTRAVNQQSVSGLVATLGPISASEIMYALLAEQRAGDPVELPKELVQDVESKPGSYQEAPAIEARNDLGWSHVCRS